MLSVMDTEGVIDHVALRKGERDEEAVTTLVKDGDVEGSTGGAREGTPCDPVSATYATDALVVLET